jgi:hypothetical protein
LIDMRLRPSEQGARTQDLVAQLGGVEFDQNLAFLDPVVDVDIDLEHRSRQLAADADRARWLQGAVGGDRQRQVAASHRLGRVDRPGRSGLVRLPAEIAPYREREQDDADVGRRAAIPGR